MKKIIIIGGLVALLGSAYYYYSRQITLLQNLTYDFLGASISNFTGSTATLALTIRMYSQSTIEAEVQQIYLDVYINNLKVGTVQQVQPFVIPAKGYSDAQVAITFSPALLVSDVVSLLSGSASLSSMPVLITGYAKVKSSFLTVSVPFSYQSTVAALTSS